MHEKNNILIYRDQLFLLRKGTKKKANRQHGDDQGKELQGQGDSHNPREPQTRIKRSNNLDKPPPLCKPERHSDEHNNGSQDPKEPIKVWAVLAGDRNVHAKETTNHVERDEDRCNGRDLS